METLGRAEVCGRRHATALAAVWALVGAAAGTGCSWRSTSTVGPFVRDLAIDAREVRVTACDLVLAQDHALVELRPVPGGPGRRAGGGDPVLEDGTCSTRVEPRTVSR